MKMTIEKAIKILEEEKEESCLLESYGDGDTEWAKAYNMAIYALKHKPKTGQWIKRFEDEEERYYCTACSDYEYFTSKYCPNCGAKMEVEE